MQAGAQTVEVISMLAWFNATQEPLVAAISFLFEAWQLIPCYYMVVAVWGWEFRGPYSAGLTRVHMTHRERASMRIVARVTWLQILAVSILSGSD